MDANLITVLGVGAVLGLATITGWLLKLRVREDLSRRYAENWNARVRSWWWMVAVGSAALLLGHGAVLLLFVLVSSLALREFFATASIDGADHWCMTLALSVLLPLQYGAVLMGDGRLVLCCLPALTVPLSQLARSRRRSCASRDRLRWEFVLAVSVCVYGLSFAVAPLWLFDGLPAQERLGMVVFVVLLSQASDVFQFLWGTSMGRRLIAPRISPNKTVEGLIGGVLCTAAAGAVIAPVIALPVLPARILGALIAVTGFCGGLVLSAVKRQRGLKDWGTLLPGHGGVLDRVDSLWLSAPVYVLALIVIRGLGESD